MTSSEQDKTSIEPSGNDIARPESSGNADQSESADDQGSEGESPEPPAEPARLGLGGRLRRIFRPGTISLRDDLEDALAVAGGDTNFSAEERAMLHNILRLREVRVEDVMVPRTDILAVEETMPIGALIVEFERNGHSRMPVYCDVLDDPKGMVHIRDVMAYLASLARGQARKTNGNGGNGKTSAKRATHNGGNGGGATNRELSEQLSRTLDLARVDLSKSVKQAQLTRPILFVPPSMLAGDLMVRMRATRTQMALVIDEYGGTDGLVSLEDIVEMVVGDIEDEHDDEDIMVSKSAEGVYLADAKAELEDVAALIGPDFDVTAHAQEADTLGGLIFAELGRIPVRGEVIPAINGFEFHVLEADLRRIKRVRIVRTRQADRRRRPLQARDGEKD